MTTPLLVNPFEWEAFWQASANHAVALRLGWVSEMRCTMGNPLAYSDTLATRWASGRTFVVAEHDIVATPAKLTELHECPYPWCACVYAYLDRADVVPGLGLTKFDGTLLTATLNLVDDIRRLRWHQLDDYLFRVLSRRGFMRHLHGRVEHRKGRL